MLQKIELLKTKIRAGVLPAMASPVYPDTSECNSPVLIQLIDFLIAAGVKGLFIGGTTGEGILMSPEQRRTLHEDSMKALAGRVPALIHVGANTTSGSISLAQHAAELGADAIVAVTPYFYKIHDDALFNHFAAIAVAAPSTPIFVYDIPHMAVNGISPELIERLASDIPSFAGLKSSNADTQQVRRLIDATPGEKIFLVGNEAVGLGNLALGADGMISGLATAIPEPFVTMVSAFFAGDLDLARMEQKKINRILALLPAGARIGALKKILQQRGIDVGPPIAPLPIAPEDWSIWKQLSGWVG
ncbi:MAG TPA: dihydrodipicolinate synthase family protein [Patescibacteria group bacterium]|nr:dihydrodipicolinate synthase family protein [Patescibacteria group bacterium]